MASLLERMSGPVRTHQNGPRNSSPYARPPKGDMEKQWSHDLFDNSLSARLTDIPVPPTRSAAVANHTNSNIARRAFADAFPATTTLSIKGAGRTHNVVEVTGLVSGTTAADLIAIFKRCGEITKGLEMPSARGVEGVTIRLIFKEAASAAAAVSKFHGQPADGKTLSVKLVGVDVRGPTLAGRLGGSDGLGIVRAEGSVDALMASSDSGSKMRSDSLVGADPRAHVLIAPPGANPSDYTQQTPKGPRNGFNHPRRGNKRGGRRGGLNTRMDTD